MKTKIEKEITYWRDGNGQNLRSTVLAIATELSRQTFIPIRIKIASKLDFMITFMTN